MLKHEKQEIIDVVKDLVKKSADELRQELEKKLAAIQKQADKPEKSKK